MQNWCVNPERQTAEHMILSLAGMCNGAATWDGTGFNKIDTQFGHSLAQWAQQGRAWSVKQALLALKLITKYSRQLGGKEFVREWMQNPNFAHMPQDPENLSTPNRKLTSQDRMAVFQFNYDPKLIAEIKQIRGEHKGRKYYPQWDSAAKVWRVEVNETSITSIMNMAREWGFEIEERFEVYYSRVVEKQQHMSGLAEESRVLKSLGSEPGVHVVAGHLQIVHDDPRVLSHIQDVLAKWA